MQYAAFLRGVNLGRRRIANDELCTIFDELGLHHPAAFLASGNVVFEAPRGPIEPLTRRIERGLRDALTYDVRVFLRTADAVQAIASCDSLPKQRKGFVGKRQVVFLAKRPTPATRRQALAFQTNDDLLAIDRTELYWLPRGGLLDSPLDVNGLERVLGATTTRTHRTVSRLAAKFFA